MAGPHLIRWTRSSSSEFCADSADFVGGTPIDFQKAKGHCLQNSFLNAAQRVLEILGDSTRVKPEMLPSEILEPDVIRDGEFAATLNGQGGIEGVVVNSRKYCKKLPEGGVYLISRTGGHWDMVDLEKRTLFFAIHCCAWHGAYFFVCVVFFQVFTIPQTRGSPRILCVYPAWFKTTW